LKKPTWIGTGEVLPKTNGDFLLDFVLVLSNKPADIKSEKTFDIRLKYETAVGVLG